MAWGFSVALILSATEYPSLPGIVLCFMGAMIRVWASGYLLKDSKPAVGGPYRYTRNPLYFGTYLMALGVALATGNWILLGVITFVFAAVYHFIILDEESKLHRIFGPAYAAYQGLVPRFFPRLWPASTSRLAEVNPDREHLNFSFQTAAKNKAWDALAAFGGLIGFVALAAFVRQTWF